MSITSSAACGEKIGKPLNDDGLFEAFGHQFRAERFGIGIETASFAKIADKAQRHSTVKRMRDSMLDRDLIIGVDRLDYSKGITNRMEAFEHFLKVDPGNRGKVIFCRSRRNLAPKCRNTRICNAPWQN